MFKAPLPTSCPTSTSVKFPTRSMHHLIEHVCKPHTDNGRCIESVEHELIPVLLAAASIFLRLMFALELNRSG